MVAVVPEVVRVSFKPALLTEEFPTWMFPCTSSFSPGLVVPIPTLLFVESTYRVLVSTVRFEDKVSAAKVLLPETVRVSETRLFELRVKGPIPMVLVGGSWRMVGTCLEKAVKFDERVLTLSSRVARSMMRVSRVREEAWAEGMKLLIILVSVFWTLGF